MQREGVSVLEGTSQVVSGDNATRVLHIAFAGKHHYSHGSQMAAQLRTTVAVERPTGVLVDLLKYKYEFGNDVYGLFIAGYDKESRTQVPVCIVADGETRASLEGLYSAGHFKLEPYLAFAASVADGLAWLATRRDLEAAEQTAGLPHPTGHGGGVRRARPSASTGRSQLIRGVGQTSMMNSPPEDWNDKDDWDRYFSAELLAGRTASDPDFIILRFLTLVHEKGGRVWFPGCGLDPYPTTYAERNCKVLATDFSRVAVRYQRRLATAFRKETPSAKVHGTFAVSEHDFTQGPVAGRFDVVINCRAFQGLSSSAMVEAAKHFYAALRPGGACVIDTMNVQGDRRNLIEDSLMAAGFYIPFHKSERWYREQLDATGIVYGMLMGRPRIPGRDQYPPEHSGFAKRDQQILDSFRVEYERRCQDEAPEVNARTSDPAAIVALVVYATG